MDGDKSGRVIVASHEKGKSNERPVEAVNHQT